MFLKGPFERPSKAFKAPYITRLKALVEAVFLVAFVMASASSDEIAASASSGAEEAAPAAVPAAAAAAAARRRPGPGHLLGPYFLLLFVSVEQGLWKGFDAGTCFDEAAAKYPFGHAVALGLCQWRLIRDSEILPVPLRKLEDTRFDGASKFGYVAYQMKRLAQLESPFAMGQLNQRSAMQATSGLSAKCYDFDSRQFGSMQRLSDIAAQWQRELPPKFLRTDFNRMDCIHLEFFPNCLPCSRYWCQACKASAYFSWRPITCDYPKIHQPVWSQNRCDSS